MSILLRVKPVEVRCSLSRKVTLWWIPTLESVLSSTTAVILASSREEVLSTGDQHFYATHVNTIEENTFTEIYWGLESLQILRIHIILFVDNTGKHYAAVICCIMKFCYSLVQFSNYPIFWIILYYWPGPLCMHCTGAWHDSAELAH